MEKKLSDYLLLYPKCKVFVRAAGGVAYEDEIEAIIIDDSVNLKQYGDYYFDDQNDAMIQLYLRPLSSMTEEEMKEIVLVNYLVSATLKEVWLSNSIIYFTTSGLTGGGNIDLCKTNPETFHWLLSKHFDLFGLIEAGIAIDKTKPIS